MLIFGKKSKIDISTGNLVKKKMQNTTYKIRKDWKEITIVKMKINHKWTTLQNLKTMKYFILHENVNYQNRAHLI